MIKLLKKYGVELKLKKCDLFRLIEGQKDTFLEDGFAFKMTNEEEMFKYVKENNIEITEIEKISYQILHGKIGADIAKKKYGLDEQIQNAIKYHTTTSPEMDTLAKIVYVSDKIEMNRKSEGYDLEYERELAQKDLDKTVLYIIDASIKSLVEKGKLIEKEVDTRNYLILKSLKV